MTFSPITMVGEGLDESARAALESVRRVLTPSARGDHEEEADAIAEKSAFEVRAEGLGDDEREYRMPVLCHTTVEHMSHRLPRLKGCPTCDEGKHLHKYRRRRATPFVQLIGSDAVEAPFGTLVHLDWIEVKRNTVAYRAARRALIFTDDITKFLGGSPSNSNTKEVVVESVHGFDDVPPAIRRWWSDRAPELEAASRYIRTIRPLAHFTSIPWRHAPRAERSNRSATGGATAVLMQSGLSEAW